MIPFDQWFGPTTSVTLNKEACVVLAQLATMTAVAKVQYLFTYFGGGIEVEVEANVPGEIQWPFALVRKNNHTLWFIGGSPHRSIVRQIINSFAEADSLNWNYNVHALAVKYGDQILGDPSYRKYEGQDRHRFFGWSFGGVIACYLFQRKPVGPPPPLADIVSYGQPRGCIDKFSDKWGQPIRRWWMADDIVTAMPPHQSEAPGTNTLLWGAVLGSRANTFVHPRGGVQLHTNGTVTYWDETNPYWSNRTFPLTSIEGWWYEQELSHGHNLGLYASAFQRAIDLLPQPVTPAPFPLPQDEPEYIRPRERPEIVRRAAAEIRTELNNVPSLVRDYQFTNIDPSTHKPFRARVINKLWFVVKDQEVVDVGPGKRVAKRLARQFNKAARGR